ncbi:MAG TPA: hypothetical protein VMS35_01950 [Nitrososphaeraceae archaeon]|nr:hypothetical protein [Nitrososphaeraceae archaeon]
MSSVDPVSQKILFDTLFTETDLKKQQKIFIDKGDEENILKFFALRRQNFVDVLEVCKTTPVDLTVQAYINQHRGEMELELKLYDHQNDVNKQIAQMTSKIDSFEEKLADKEKRIERLEKIIDKLKNRLPETEKD